MSASSKTLEALAQVIRALAPEVSGVSFHDFAADTLWRSEDFLLPEDFQLVEDSLLSDAGGNLDNSYAPREDGNYSLAIPVRDSFWTSDQHRYFRELPCNLVSRKTLANMTWQLELPQ
jgi:hypothetical protein